MRISILRNTSFLLLFLFATSSYYLSAQDYRKSKNDDLMKEQLKEKQPEWFPGVIEGAVDDSVYVIGPNDILTVAIISTRYLVYDVQVSSDGKILIPLLGELFVKNQTLRAVRKIIQSLVDQNFKNAQAVVNLARARMVKVSVTGAVRKPDVVFLAATARVSEAINEAGGFVQDTSVMRNIRVVRNIAETLWVDILAYQRCGDISKNPFVLGGDVIYVPPRDQLVGIFGSVKHEGRIDYMPGERLYDLIKLAQGFKAEAFKDSIQIVRFQSDHTTTKTFFLNLKNYPDDQSVNIELQPSDLVLVRGIPRYHFQRLVILKGEVKYPGSYPIEKDKTTLTSIIQRAGGFTKDASLEEAIVIRKQGENEKDKEFERLSKVPAADMQEDEYEYFKARSRERMGQMVVNFKKLFLENDLHEDIYLREEDVIEIPEIKNYIRIIGRVINPGNVIYSPKWNYLNYIDFVGGYGWRADEGDVRIIKARTGEIVDATKTKDYYLEPGDSIWVPEEPIVKFWTIFVTALGVVSQIAGIVAIVIAISNLSSK